MRKKFSLGKYLFGFGTKSNYSILKWVGAVALALFAFIDGSVAGEVALMSTPLLASLSEDEQKVVKALQEENKKTIDAFKLEINGIVKEQVGEGITQDKLDKLVAELEDKYKEIAGVDLQAVTKNLQDVQDKQVELAKAMTKLKSNPIATAPTNRFKEDLEKWIDSDEFKEWKENVERGKGGHSPKLELKYSLTEGSSRTGLQLVTSRSTKVGDAFQPRRYHVRDLLQVVPTDMPNHVFDQVTEWIPGIDMNSENGEANSFDIKTEEKTVNSKRIAGYMDISNNSLRSAQYLTNHILNRAPEKLLNVEDFQLIFGDGTGNNVEGFKVNATEFDLDGPSFVAGDISSAASYAGGTATELTFASAHNLSNAYQITIADSTNYNGTWNVNVKSEVKIVIDSAYTAESTAAWTATTNHYLKESVDGAQEWDVLISAAAFMANSEYKLTAYVLNPATSAKIEMLKATDLQYVGKIERIDGVLYIAGIPVIEHNSMPANEFLGGDFEMAAELQQYEGVTMRFIEDTDYARKNKQMLLISEQIVLPIYNPFMFVSGTFAEAKAQLETP